MGLAAVGEYLVDGLSKVVQASRERAVAGEHLYLSGLFAPCREEVAGAELLVAEGALPAGLSGLCVAVRILAGRGFAPAPLV